MSVQAVPALLGLVGLVIAFVIYGIIAKLKVSDPKVESIGKQIHIGAMAFMRREYTILLASFSLLSCTCHFDWHF